MTVIRVRIIKPKNEKIAANTAYYRNNKKNRHKVHTCPHCNYETTGPKCILINHINAKHTQNTNKPFQCNHCNKGFSQKGSFTKSFNKTTQCSGTYSKTTCSIKKYICVFHYTYR